MERMREGCAGNGRVSICVGMNERAQAALVLFHSWSHCVQFPSGLGSYLNTQMHILCRW